MRKAIIEVYFELLVTNFSDFLQLSFKICENYLHPHASCSHYCVCLHNISRVNQNVLVSYMSHKLRTKIMAQLNFVQRLQIANQKGLSDAFAHASYKCPVNSCFEWECITTEEPLSAPFITILLSSAKFLRAFYSSPERLKSSNLIKLGKLEFHFIIFEFLENMLCFVTSGCFLLFCFWYCYFQPCLCISK